MKQFNITNGSREVVVMNQDGIYMARLYVDDGRIATLQAWKGRTEAGARRWAAKVLGR